MKRSLKRSHDNVVLRQRRLYTFHYQSTHCPFCGSEFSKQLDCGDFKKKTKGKI